MAKCQRKGSELKHRALPVTICVVWREWLSFSWLHSSICKLSRLCSPGLWAPLCCQLSCTGGSLCYLCFCLLHLLHAALAACSLLRSVLGLQEPASLSSENGNALEFTAPSPCSQPRSGQHGDPAHSHIRTCWGHCSIQAKSASPWLLPFPSQLSFLPNLSQEYFPCSPVVPKSLI